MSSWAQKFSQSTSSGKPSVDQSEGALGRFLDPTGAYNIPLLGGLLRGATPGVELVGEALSGGTPQNPNFISPDMAKSLSPDKNALEVGMTGANAGLNTASVADLPFALKDLAVNAPSLAGYLTKGGVGKKIGQAYENASKSGITDSVGDVATELKQAVSQRLGNDPKYADIINKRISSDLVGPSVEEDPQITPNQLFQLKQQASNRLPNGFLANFQGKSATNQVDEVFRDVMGKRAADITPGIKNLNKAYQLYNTVGSPARIAGNYAVSQLVPDQAKGYLGGDVGATGILGLLENILKIGGKI